MMSKQDDRKEVGGDVKILVKHVQSNARCKRRFRSNWETKWYNGVVLNVITPCPRCTQIEALYNLGNEENKSATLNIRSVKCRDPPPNTPPLVEPVSATPSPAPVATEPPYPPPNSKHVSATPAAAPAAAASVHITTATPSSPTSPPAYCMERRRALRSRLLCMHKTDGTGMPLPVYDTPTVTKAHETLCFKSEGLDHINGYIFDKEWGVKASNGLVLSPSNKEASAGMSRLDFFMLMFLPN